MKRLILCLFAAVTAAAQNPSTNLPSTYEPTALVYTNAWVDNSSNTVASAPLNATRYETIGWQIGYRLSGTGSATNTFDFQYSLDNTNWPTAFFQSIEVPANGTNWVQTNVTMQVGAQGYVRLAQSRFGNNSGSTTTNLLLMYTPKPFVRR